MSKTITELEAEIEHLVPHVDRTRNALAVAEHRRNMLKQDFDHAAREAGHLKSRYTEMNQRGRDALFELMVRSPHRRFLRFVIRHTKREKP